MGPASPAFPFIGRRLTTSAGRYHETGGSPGDSPDCQTSRKRRSASVEPRLPIAMPTTKSTTKT